MPENAPILLTALELSAKFGGKPTARTLIIQARNGWIPSILIGRRRFFEWEKVKTKGEEDAKPK